MCGLHFTDFPQNCSINHEDWRTDWLIGLCSVLGPRQHSIGYMGDQTNSIKVLKEMLQRTKQTTKTTKYIQIRTDNNIHKKDRRTDGLTHCCRRRNGCTVKNWK